MNSNRKDCFKFIESEYVPPITMETSSFSEAGTPLNSAEKLQILHNSVVHVRKDYENNLIRYLTISDEEGNIDCLEYPNYFAFILCNPLFERDYNLWEKAAKAILKNTFPDVSFQTLKEYLLIIPVKNKELFRELSLDFYFKCISILNSDLYD